MKVGLEIYPVSYFSWCNVKRTGGFSMDELVKLIVKKTGIPEATAQMVVKIVVDYIKKKLPAPLGAQVDGLLNNAAAIQTAQNVIGNLMAAKKSTKKKK
jgi:hypothetical protein